MCRDCSLVHSFEVKFGRRRKLRWYRENETELNSSVVGGDGGARDVEIGYNFGAVGEQKVEEAP